MRKNFLCLVRARAHLRALMTQKSCAVGMRNAKLGNHLKWEKKKSWRVINVFSHRNPGEKSEKKSSGGSIFLRKNIAFKFVTKSLNENKFSLLKAPGKNRKTIQVFWRENCS